MMRRPQGIHRRPVGETCLNALGVPTGKRVPVPRLTVSSMRKSRPLEGQSPMDFTSQCNFSKNKSPKFFWIFLLMFLLRGKRWTIWVCSSNRGGRRKEGPSRKGGGGWAPPVPNHTLSWLKRCCASSWADVGTTAQRRKYGETQNINQRVMKATSQISRKKMTVINGRTTTESLSSRINNTDVAPYLTLYVQINSKSVSYLGAKNKIIKAQMAIMSKFLSNFVVNGRVF